MSAGLNIRLNPTPVAARNIVRQWENGELLVPERDDVLPWESALEQLAAARLFWEVASRPEHHTHAHVRPVFAVESDGVLWSTSSAGARKAGLLASAPQCSLATSTDGLDLVYDAVAVPVSDHHLVSRVAEAYHRKYGWPVTVTAGGGFDAPFAAPAAGPPPYRVYAFEPVSVWAFGTDERSATRSTRWDFEHGS